MKSLSGETFGSSRMATSKKFETSINQFDTKFGNLVSPVGGRAVGSCRCRCRCRSSVGGCGGYGGGCGGLGEGGMCVPTVPDCAAAYAKMWQAVH